jgi:hypothetical protein
MRTIQKTTLEYWALIAEIAGAIAVVVSVIYLALQIGQYLYYQNRDGSIPNQLWIGADAYFKQLVETKPGLKRFWSEYQHSFDDPFLPT